MSHPHAAALSPARLARKTVVFAFGYFLLFLFRNNIIHLYLGERFHFLCAFGAVILVIGALFYSSYEGGHEESCHACAHTNRSGVRMVAMIVILVASLALGFSAKPDALGIASRLNRGFMAFGANTGRFPADIIRQPGPGSITLTLQDPDSGNTFERKYTKINLMELGTFISGSGSTYAGDRVVVRGFVAQNKKLGKNRFYLVRYQVVCCVVHATAVSITVESDSAAQYENDTWLTIYGPIKEKKSIGENDLAFYIDAEKIEENNQPADPYINKWTTEKPFHF